MNESKSNTISRADTFRIIKRYVPVIGQWYYYLQRRTGGNWLWRKLMSWLFINYEDGQIMARTGNVQTAADWVKIYQCGVWEEHPISKQLSPISM